MNQNWHSNCKVHLHEKKLVTQKENAEEDYVGQAGTNAAAFSLPDEQNVVAVHRRLRNESRNDQIKLPYSKDQETPGVVSNKSFSVIDLNETTPGGKMPHLINLEYMAAELLKAVTVIIHENNLYYYNGRTYQIIKNREVLIRVMREKVSNSLFGLSGINRFNDLLVFLRADNRLIPQNYEKRLKKGNKYVVLENGVLDLQTLKLRPHSADYLTFYELDVKWKQEIHAPHFKKYLESVSGGDREIIKRIVEVFGYLLSPVNEGKCFFVMGMAPDSGKSTLGNLLQRLLGEEYVISRTAHILGDRFALGDLPGKILSLSMDLPRGRLKPEAVSILKQVTGGDTVMTEQKYEIAQNIHSNVRFLFGSNFPITISNEDNDDSFWNRMVIVPFLYSVPRKDMDMELLEKLLEEKDAIVSMCLRAMHDVIERNYRFSDCKAADEMKAQWRYSTEGSTLLKEFADEMIEVTGRKEDEVSVKALYGIYIEYCQRCREAPVTQYKMIEWMDSHLNGCERKRVHHTGMNPTSAYVGVRWAHGSVKSR